MGILDSNGTKTDSLASMKERVVTYFTSLYLAHNRAPPIPNLNIFIEESPTTIENTILRAYPTNEEVLKMVKSLPKSKAPGIDGLTAEFIIHHWETVKDDYLAAILHFFTTKRMLRSLNLATLTLIPKVQQPERLEDYRPISCIGISYKFFSKLLATKLMAILPRLISLNQLAFIKGRRISDAIGLAQEFTQGFNWKGTSRRACITIDFVKAFDTLRWDAIEAVLELMGIDYAFRQMVMSCVVTIASVSALVEGSPTQIVKMQKGLRQGDPLSPLLFVIVIEYLTRLVKKAVGDRKLELYTIGGTQVESHLAFADDVTFFCRALTKSLTALKEILDEFQDFSGLKINVGKSSIILSKRVADNVEMAAILGFQLKELPIKYLGTPVTGKQINYRDCDGLLAELRCILTRWSSKKLFYMGRIQLVE